MLSPQTCNLFIYSHTFFMGTKGAANTTNSNFQFVKLTRLNKKYKKSTRCTVNQRIERVNKSILNPHGILSFILNKHID